VRGAAPDARACADALARIAGDTGHLDALAALAHALAEIALLDGDADTATVQLDRALELHQQLEIPFERAQLQLRSGVALAAAGAREPALERLGEAYRTARRLGARPLAAQAAAQVDQLGASIEQQLGRRAAAEHDGAGLSRRELEVMRLVATGRTKPRQSRGCAGDASLERSWRQPTTGGGHMPKFVIEREIPGLARSPSRSSRASPRSRTACSRTWRRGPVAQSYVTDDRCTASTSPTTRAASVSTPSAAASPPTAWSRCTPSSTRPRPRRTIRVAGPGRRRPRRRPGAGPGLRSGP
jgi:hypothetical protein